MILRKPGILLTELLRHDYCGKRLPDNIISKVTYDNNFILRKEIEILRTRRFSVFNWAIL